MPAKAETGKPGRQSGQKVSSIDFGPFNKAIGETCWGEEACSDGTFCFEAGDPQVEHLRLTNRNAAFVRGKLSVQCIYRVGVGARLQDPQGASRIVNGGIFRGVNFINGVLSISFQNRQVARTIKFNLHDCQKSETYIALFFGPYRISFERGLWSRITRVRKPKSHKGQGQKP